MFRFVDEWNWGCYKARVICHVSLPPHVIHQVSAWWSCDPLADHPLPPSRTTKVFPNHQTTRQSGCLQCFAEVGASHDAAAPTKLTIPTTGITNNTEGTGGTSSQGDITLWCKTVSSPNDHLSWGWVTEICSHGDHSTTKRLSGEQYVRWWCCRITCEFSMNH